MTIYYENLSENNRDAIIDDLLRKRPRGQLAASMEYHERHAWCSRTGRYRTVVQCGDPNWGYDSMTLYRLQLIGLSDCRTYVRNRWGCPASTVTRRANRIWDRIQAGVGTVRREGAPGFWSVNRRYDEVTRIWAHDKEEAERIASTFFAPILGALDTPLQITFAGVGYPTQMLQYDAARTQTVITKINRLKKEIVENEQKIVKLSQNSEMISAMLNTIVAEHISDES